MKKIKTYRQYNESIRDKMKPVSYYEIDNQLKKIFHELTNIGMTEGYTKDERVVKDFFEVRWDDILEMIENGYSTDDIYSELQMDLEYYISEDEEDEEDDW